MKQNDWIVASINNPNFSVQDFRDIGLDLDNTQLLPMQEYLKSNFITQNDAFKNDQGAFSKEKFESFYKSQLASFEAFKNNTEEVPEYEYGLFDTSRKENSRVRDPHFTLELVSNPTRTTVGISARNKVGEKKFTQSELAQMSKIYDPSTEKYLDYSPNDVSLINNPIGYIKELFNEPLVIAQYEEDGTHVDPITKKLVKHSKGDYKLNEEGQYYTERLNGRSLIGKQVLSALDTLTIDGEGINKYDFFDSDSLDKSVTGSIAKAAASIAPLFFGPYVASIYSGILVGREMTKALPMLYGMIGSVFGVTEDNRVINSMAGVGQKLTGGVSDYSKQNTFTFENVANLLSDVALQWGQQKAIAKSLQTLRGGNKKIIEDAYRRAGKEYEKQFKEMIFSIRQNKLPNSTYQYLGDPKKWDKSALGSQLIQKYTSEAKDIVQKRARFGADAALAYMAIVSNTDVYESMLEHGASKREASAVALGSTIGMFGVDRYLGLGELFFDDLTSESQRAMRKVFKKEADSWKDSLIKIAQNPEINAKNKLNKLINNGIQLGKNATTQFIDDLKFHTTGFVGKAVGEGLEEVSEEAVADLFKQIYEFAGELGYDTSTKDVGAWENMLPRYGMSLFGGALGGAVFHGVELAGKQNSQQSQQLDELIYLVRNGKTNELLSTLDDWRKKGKLGSTKLSANKFEKDPSGQNNIYLTSDSEKDSQNEFIYNRIKETILQLDALINSTGGKLNDDELFKQMVLSEARFLALKDYLKDQSYSTGYQKHFQNILKEIVLTEEQLEKNSKTIDGTAPVINEDGTSNIMTDEQKRNLTQDQITLREQNLDKLRQKLEQLNLQKQNFLSGKESLHYTRKMLFAIDPSIHSAFISMTFQEWVEANYPGKDVNNLSQEEAQFLKDEYLKYKKSGQETNLNTQFQTFLNVEKELTPALLDIQNNQEQFRKYKDLVEKLFNQKDGPFSKNLISWDDKLEDESDAEFASKDEEMEGEDPEQFKLRRSNRSQKIDQLNQDAVKSMVDQVNSIIQQSGGFVDPVTVRRIKENISIRKKDLVQNAIWDAINSSRLLVGFEGIQNIQQLEQEVSNEIFKLNYDLSNIKEISETIKNLVQNPVRDNLTRRSDLIGKFGKALGYTIENDPQLFGHLQNKPITGEVIDEMISAWRNSETVEDPYIIDQNNKVFDTEYLEEAGITEDQAATILNIFRNTPEEERKNQKFQSSTKEEIEQQVNNITEEVLEVFNDRLTNAIENIKNNPQIQLLINIDKQIKQINPVQQLIKNLGLKLDKNSKNLENVLQTISDDFEEIKDVEDFRLTEDQRTSFEEAQYLINLAKTYISAAATSSNYDTPIGHNKTINEFAENHKDIFQDFTPLATIDQDIASFYIQELDSYLSEIEYWTQISDNNQTNKKRKFIKAETNFNKTKYDFFRINRNAFKFSLDDNDVDLLKGFEQISSAEINDDDNILIVNQVENLFYDNLHSILNQGYTFYDILEKSEIIQNICDINEIEKQLTTPLDERINYGALTDYDKIIYLFTISSLKADEFNSFIKDIVEQETKIAPLTVQEYLSRIGIASIVGKDIIDSGMNFLKEKMQLPFPILNALVFIDGVAGVGKTQVVAKTVSKYIDSDNIWLTAPKESQRKALHDSIQKGEEKSIDDIFKNILDPEVYEELLDDINNNRNNSKYYNVTKLLDGSQGVILKKESITLKESNPPELIIIDEVTHISNILLQILNEYANKHKIRVLCLGDTNQNGFNKKGFNIDREISFTLRAPKLSISLRDVNIQKQSNLEKILELLNQLQSLSSKQQDPFYDHKHSDIQKHLENLNLKVFNQEVINGDLITSQITPELADKLKSETTIGFVGNTNSKAFKTLQSSGITPTVMDAVDVQGQEFDYIIIDKEWKYNKDTTSSLETLNFLQDLYTMISRGRKGSIIIDNGLSQIIGPNREEYHTALAPNLKEAVEEFRKSKLDILARLLPQDNTKTSQQPKSSQNQENQEESSSSKNEAQEPAQEPTPEKDSEKQQDKDNDKEEQEKPANKIILKEDETLQDETPETPEQELKTQQLVETELQNNQMQDKTDQDSVNLERLLNQDLPIRVYGSAHLSGYERVKIEENGKQVNTFKRSIDNRDLGVFTKNEYIRSGQEKDNLVNQLLNFKSTVLYGHDWNSLSDSNKDIIREKDFQNIQYKIEVREKQNFDNFVGYTGLAGEDGKTNEVRTINDLVYSLVATFKNKDNQDCIVTLGLLADPNTWKKQLPNLQQTLTNQINELQAQNKDVAQLEEWRDKGLPNKIDSYSQLMNIIASQYKDQKSKKALYFDVSPRFSGLTYLRDKNNMGNPIEPKTLYINEGTPEYNKGERGYLQTHPYLVASDIYVYNETVPGVKDDAMRGKAVMFVSRDTTLSPSELPRVYISQKEDAANHPEQTPFQREFKPSVRMIKLNSRGVGFDTLASASYGKIYKTAKDIKGEEEVNLFPFELDYMGTRMFVSMWNFRANLKQFLEKVGTFMETNNFDSTKLEKLLDADYQLYLYAKDKKVSVSNLSEEEINDVLKSLNVSIDDYNKVIAFNDDLANKVREFRLGGSARGAMIRRLTNINKDNIFYSGIENPNGIYINYTLASKYYKLIDSIFDNLFNDIFKLTDPETKEPWPIDRLISPNAKKRNSVSGLIDEIFANSATLNWEEDGTKFNIKFPSKKTFKVIPTLLVQVHKEVIRYLVDEDYEQGTAITRTIDGEKQRFSIDKILKCITPGVNYDNNTLVDPSFVDMFRLMFHGTLENVHSTDFKATDAYFKEGLKTDAMTSSEAISINGKMLFKKCITNKQLFEIDTEVDMPVFDVFLTDIDKALNRSNKNQELKPQKKAIDNDVLNNLRTVLEETIQYGDLVDQVLQQTTQHPEDFYTKLLETADFETKNVLESKFFNNTIDLNTVVGFKLDKDTLIPVTVRELIEERAGEKIPETEKGSCQNNEYCVYLPSNKMARLKIEKNLNNNINLNVDIFNTTVQDQDIILQQIKNIINKEDYKNASETLKEQMNQMMSKAKNFQELSDILNGYIVSSDFFELGENDAAIANSIIEDIINTQTNCKE